MHNLQEQPLSAFRERLVSVRVREEDSVREAVSLALKQPGCQGLCVVDDAGHLRGVIDVRKLFRAVFFHHADPHLMTRELMKLASSETVGELMVTDPFVASENETLGSAIDKMVQHELSQLPVLDEQGILLGSISMAAILDVWLERSDD